MKRIICLLLVSFTVWGVSAQDVYYSSGKPRGYKKKEVKGYDPSKLVLGGGLNLGYAGDYANVGVSPKIGYKLNKFLAVGVGLGYQFYKAPEDYTVNNKPVYIHENIVTPSLWAKCTVYEPIFIAADLEYNAIFLKDHEVKYDLATGDPYLVDRRTNVGALCMLMGAGVKQKLGGRTCATIELMYDLLQADYSPYRQQLVYRVGIFVGL
jgi:hypothetical protein